MPSSKILIFLLFSFILISPFIHPIYDNDFWWHLRTGEEIYKTGSLPLKDTLSFTTYKDHEPSSSERIDFILRTYWLSQLLYYISWNSIGISGIIIIRLIVFLIIFFVIYRKLRSDGMSPYVSLSMLIFAGSILVRFSSDRPQLFSYMFTAIYIYLLEDRRWHKYLLPVITLLWANMHGTALMAIPVGVIYLINEMVKKERDPENIFIIALSLLTIYLNPMGYKGITLFFDIFKTSHVEFNTDYLSPVSQARFLGEFYPQYWIMVLFTPFLLFLSDLNLRGKLLILFQLMISLYSTRFMPFFLITWLLFSGVFIKRYLDKIVLLRSAITIISIISMLSTIFIYRDEFMRGGIKDEKFPVEAINFIRENSIKGRLFNWYEWGGYIEWHLKDLKTFIDSRALRLDIFDEYIKSIYSEESPDILERYKIDIVLLPLVNPVDGMPVNIIYRLLRESNWSPINTGENYVLFIRHGTSTLKREDVIKKIIKNLSMWCDDEARNPIRWKNLARAYYEMGLKKDAFHSYMKAYEIDPHDPYTQMMLSLLREYSGP